MRYIKHAPDYLVYIIPSPALQSRDFPSDERSDYQVCNRRELFEDLSSSRLEDAGCTKRLTHQKMVFFQLVPWYRCLPLLLVQEKRVIKT